MTATTATFAATFREIVIPDLQKLTNIHGALLAIGCRTWTEAYAEVERRAIARGALHLPDGIFQSLQDWIATQLLRRADDLAPAIAEAGARSDRIASEIDAYFEGFSG